MEAAEDSSLEPAIGWLAQTILETLLMDKLDAWIRQAGLADAIESLRSEVERVEMVVAAVRGRATGNKPLSRSLARLKDLLYDADDAVDELDYYRLQQQVEGDPIHNPESTHGAEAERVDETSRGTAAAADIPNGSGSNLRSKHWKDFTVIKWVNGKAVEAKCNLCGAHPIKCGSGNGTSVLSNHLKSKGCIRKRRGSPNPSSTGDATENVTPIAIGDSSSRKRKRVDEESSEITTPWDKAELSNGIQKLTGRLQDIRVEVSEVLKLHGPDFASSSINHQSTASDHHLRTTSSLVPRKVYGRDAEKNAIIQMIMEKKSNGVTVLPIVGIAGVGKTTLAQLVYNDPDVKSQFDTKIWVWVSCNFDKVRLTREMLDFVTQDRHEGSLHTNERHEGISSLAKLQEILKERMEYQPKRFLLILDDVWDNLDDERWSKLLSPLISSQVKGNVILVTTRNLCVALKKGTLEPIQLCALANEDFWLLFKSRAFGDENYKGNQCLSIIGRQIAEKLKGNPLAAETAGELLRGHLTIDHWTNILKDEHWKSLQLSTGIMPALKLSYDQLPYHLQQCFLYTSIFPSSYRFLGEELVRIWISQGFVKYNHSTKILEEVGWNYLTVLVNLGFFQQAEREEPSPGSETCFAMCGLAHDFARMVSSTECVIIDGLQCNKMPQTIRHLSIVTDSVYNKKQHGNIHSNEKFEENLKNTVTVTSVRNLRTLILIGQYDSSLFKSLCFIFRKTPHLRLLQMSATSDDSNSFLLSLVNHTHLRYLKLKPDKLDKALPQSLIKFFHLEVLDVGSNTDITLPNGMHSLLSLRHLVAEKGVYTSIASIGTMTSLQELHDFNVQISKGFEITQLQSMKKLVQLGVSQLDKVKTREEAYGARLRNKEQLEKLRLSWMDTSSQELLRMDERSPSSDPSMDRAIEVLEGLEPHQGLKHLQISGYCGATSPTWLAANTSVTTLQALHLDYCQKWQILPSMERFPFLKKLELSNLPRVTEILIPSLEELVLVKMPKLERCLCTSVGGLNSSLKALHIEKCRVLKTFYLLNEHIFKIEQRSWLSGLGKLIMCDCPHLEVLNPLPPSTTFSELLISGVSTLPRMKGSSNIKLHIGGHPGTCTDQSCDNLRILDNKILAFHNLTSLKSIVIHGCPNLMSISFEGFSHLVSLKSLDISHCGKLLSSHVMPEHTLEDVSAANCKVFSSLESLTIRVCGIVGSWLSLMLRHAPSLEELILDECQHITLLSVQEEENSLSNLSDREAQEELLHIPFNLISSLKKIVIQKCLCLRFNGSKKDFSGFTSLEKLHIWGCHELLLCLVRKDGSDDQANGRWLLPESLGELDIGDYPKKTLQPCFPSNLTSLKKLVLSRADLVSLQLHSCTALEELKIEDCDSLSIVEGLQSLGSLRDLTVLDCPCLPSYLESFSRQCYELLPRLGTLVIDDPDVLTTSFCKHLTSLHSLQLCIRWIEVTRLTEEQERALVLLKSLQELTFSVCRHLIHLPAGLHTLPSLKRLKIEHCLEISSLPETGLPVSLEELEIKFCSEDLNDQCRLLATSKLNVDFFPLRVD